MDILLIYWPAVVIGAVLTWFIVSLILFLTTKRDDPKRRSRRIMMIVSAVIAGVLIAVSATFITLFLIAIRNM